MKRLLRTALVWACCVSPFGLASAAEDAKPAPAAEAAKPAAPAEGARKPIKALLVTGGCCHDYERQKVILSRGISARADVVWTIVHQGGTTTDTMIPLYQDPDWAKGFDVVVHNECFAGVKDKAWVDRILRPHREGLPAVLIHCAMHCYRTGDDRWFEFVGLQSPGHGPQFPYTVENLVPDHPIMGVFGKEWRTPAGELYHTIKIWPTATPLAQARRKDNNEPQVCIWTNQYHKARVFATTIGHHNETMVEPTYLDTLARGLLWSTDRLDEKSFRKTTPEIDDEIRKLAKAPVAPKVPDAEASAPCCGAGNLAQGKKTSASSEESGKGNLAAKAIDGSLNTRWCANGGKPGEWWQVDLGKPEHVKSARIHWEGKAAYKYKIEASADGKEWKTVVDQADNKKQVKVAPHEFDAPDARYLKVTYLGNPTGGWGSFWEFETYTGPLPPLPPGADNPGEGGGVPGVSEVEVNPKGEFQVKMFGTPPDVNYPVCLTAAATGEVFVGVDEQGSLGKDKGRGKVLRCLDTDGDGQADKISEFCKVDHPRGLIYDQGRLWVLHPPYLTLYIDRDGDGKADEEKRLIDGISTDQVAQRGADHTTNGIRMGIDGWIYIAVGDFGFTKAVGADGTVLSRRGGGVVRIRPDGSDMEIFAWGLRNILDCCIDPQLNMFTRDNTNDGGDWNVRFSHILQSAEYGYPSQYINFSDEIMPPLADYGGGSGCGGMYFQDARWPAPFNNAVYTCDWGRSEVYRHNPTPDGATFKTHQESFLKLQRPTDIDVDGSGRMYVASWKNGNFSYSGPNVGYVVQIVPKDFVPRPFPDLPTLSDSDLRNELTGPSAVHRQHASLEFLRRGRSPERSAMLFALAADVEQSLPARIAAVFTLKQLDGADANPYLLKLVGNPAIREYALRALTDRKSQLQGVPTEPFVAALRDEDPRVRAQALISLGRLGRKETAAAILPLSSRPADAARPTKEPVHTQPDPAAVLPHLAVRSLAALDAVDVALAGLDGPHAAGAVQTLRRLHSPAAVDGLVKRLDATGDPVVKKTLLALLVRLYFREGDYDKGWWGTRPDTSGPYFDRKPWSESGRIGAAIQAAAAKADPALREFVVAELNRHQVKLEGLATGVAAGPAEPTKAIVLEKLDPSNPHLIGNQPYESVAAHVLKTPGDVARGKIVFEQRQCVACHTFANGQTPKGPHLVDIGKRYKRPELVESILKPSTKLAQGFETWQFVTVEGKTLTGFVVSESADTIKLRQIDGLAQELKKDEIEERAKVEKSMMPDGLGATLTPDQLADLIAYLESLK